MNSGAYYLVLPQRHETACVFVSSTFYDLKYLRASLAALIDSLGFEAVMAENHTITYAPDLPLDESCYRDVGNADLFVLIVGGRYGSLSTKSRRTAKQTPESPRQSITHGEFEAAVRNRIPTYVLVDTHVYGEYETYLANAGRKNLKFAHVESPEVFEFLKDILGRSLSIPLCRFAAFADIEPFLREQWAGLFRDLLQRRSAHEDIADLSAQISALGKLNETLRTYVEAVLAHLQPAKSKQLIGREEAKLREVEVFTDFVVSDYWKVLSRTCGKSLDSLLGCVKNAKSFDDLIEAIFEAPEPRAAFREMLKHPTQRQDLLARVNSVRQNLGLPEIA